MPGVNLPIGHLGFYIITLLFCAFLHEAGHALAAIRERVRVHGFGVFVFGFYPGAYVDLNTADLLSLSPLSQLRVYCAGVWHNAIIALLSVLIFYTLPLLLSPGYHFGSGVGVTYLREGSVVTGQRGLSLGDAITRINSCPVNQQSDWYKCLQEAYVHPSGYCVSGAYLSMLDEKSQAVNRGLSAIVSVNKQHEQQKNGINAQLKVAPSNDCCAVELSSTHLCFSYVASMKPNVPQGFACLPARKVTERTSCNSTADCRSMHYVRSGSADSVGMFGGISTRSMYCVVPSLEDNVTRLVRLAHNRRNAPAILFLGPLDDLISSIGVSDYVPRWPSLLSPNLPYYIGLVCTYLFSLSGALVILNVVPCYALDGQWILKAFMDLFFCNLLPSRSKRHLFVVIMTLGSSLLGMNIFLALYYLFLQTKGEVNLSTNVMPVSIPNRV